MKNVSLEEDNAFLIIQLKFYITSIFFWDSKEIKPVNPKGNQPWILIEGLMLMLKFQYLGHLIQITDSLEKTMMLGKIEGFIVCMEMVKMWMLGIQPFQVWELVIKKNYNKDTSMYSLYVLLMSVLSAYSVCGLQFSCSVMSNSLWPGGLQHARLPCPSPTPGPWQTHVHRVGDTIQPSYPLLFPSLFSLLLWTWTEQIFYQHVTSVTNLLV